MPWKPSEPGEVPTLGWYVLDWIEENLARPAVGEDEPFCPYREQEDLMLRWYEIDASYYLLRALQAVGLVWDVAGVPAHVRDDVAPPQRLAIGGGGIT